MWLQVETLRNKYTVDQYNYNYVWVVNTNLAVQASWQASKQRSNSQNKFWMKKLCIFWIIKLLLID